MTVLRTTNDVGVRAGAQVEGTHEGFSSCAGGTYAASKRFTNRSTSFARGSVWSSSCFSKNGSPTCPAVTSEHDALCCDASFYGAGGSCTGGGANGNDSAGPPALVKT